MLLSRRRTRTVWVPPLPPLTRSDYEVTFPPWTRAPSTLPQGSLVVGLTGETRADVSCLDLVRVVSGPPRDVRIDTLLSYFEGFVGPDFLLVVLSSLPHPSSSLL